MSPSGSPSTIRIKALRTSQPDLSLAVQPSSRRWLRVWGGTEVEGDVHGGDEAAGEVLDVHFGHVSEVAADVGGDEGCEFDFVLVVFLHNDEGVLAEFLIPFPAAVHLLQLLHVVHERMVDVLPFLTLLLRLHYLYYRIVMIATLRTLTRLWAKPLALLSQNKKGKQVTMKPLQQMPAAKTDPNKHNNMQQPPKKEKQKPVSNKVEPINWKKYGKEVSDVFESKRKLIDIDLAFLAGQIGRGEVPLNQQLTAALKEHIKTLKQANFSLLPQLSQLAFSLGIISPPQLFLQSYIDHFRHNPFTIEENQSIGFPSYFLKRVGLQTILLCAGRSLEEAAVALRFFGSILSLNQLKRVDELCSERIPTMTPEQAAKLFSIFRQIRKRGAFVEMVEKLLLEKQGELTNRSLIMTAVSFLEMGNREALGKLEETISERMKKGSLTEGEAVSVLHVMHKYKAGGLPLWTTIEEYMLERHKTVPFEHLFLVMSGLCRNYTLKATYLEQLVEGDSSMSYTEKLEDKQFVEFYFVLYAHFTVLPSSHQQKYAALLAKSLKAPKLKSVYAEIQSFFLFLLEVSPSAKMQHLRAAYPDDTLLALLSWVHDFENTDIREKQAYESQLISRCGESIWKRHCAVVVAQEFIRYKLVSAGAASQSSGGYSG